MYSKLFNKILDCSIWLEPQSTRIVWITCWPQWTKMAHASSRQC